MDIDYAELLQLQATYAAVVDAGDWDAWCELFIDDCCYRLQPRENHDRGFPLATLSFESKGMLKDRVATIRETSMFAPRYLRHIVHRWKEIAPLSCSSVSGSHGLGEAQRRMWRHSRACDGIDNRRNGKVAWCQNGLRLGSAVKAAPQRSANTRRSARLRAAFSGSR